MGKSRNTLQIAAWIHGKRGMGMATTLKAFSLEDAPLLAVGFFTPSMASKPDTIIRANTPSPPRYYDKYDKHILIIGWMTLQSGVEKA
jgi:hypothetical protein